MIKVRVDSKYSNCVHIKCSYMLQKKKSTKTKKLIADTLSLYIFFRSYGDNTQRKTHVVYRNSEDVRHEIVLRCSSRVHVMNFIINNFWSVSITLVWEMCFMWMIFFLKVHIIFCFCGFVMYDGVCVIKFLLNF